jgi:DNA-binding response OmpR family regulator
MVQGRRILVVDDELKIVEVVRSYLENSGYEVSSAYTGKEAIRLFDAADPALVVLDLMLPDMTGEEVCKAIRRRSAVPVIMLTAKIGEEDILKGLDIGADDYVTKPFSPRQLVARVAAVLRRTEAGGGYKTDILRFNQGELSINTAKYEVKRLDETVGLTPIEFKMLITLVGHPAKVFTRDELVTLVLGEDFDGYDRTVDTHIKNLRQKIEPEPKNPRYILTVHGVGYRFGGEQDETGA